jgi:preprotein translocase subunit Sec63
MKDRIAMVEQILAENDYYGILGLERTCAQSEIRRAYISVSVQFTTSHITDLLTSKL